MVKGPFRKWDRVDTVCALLVDLGIFRKFDVLIMGKLWVLHQMILVLDFVQESCLYKVHVFQDIARRLIFNSMRNKNTVQNQARIFTVSDGEKQDQSWHELAVRGKSIRDSNARRKKPRNLQGRSISYTYTSIHPIYCHDCDPFAKTAGLEPMESADRSGDCMSELFSKGICIEN